MFYSLPHALPPVSVCPCLLAHRWSLTGRKSLSSLLFIFPSLVPPFHPLPPFFILFMTFLCGPLSMGSFWLRLYGYAYGLVYHLAFFGRCAVSGAGKRTRLRFPPFISQLWFCFFLLFYVCIRSHDFFTCSLPFRFDFLLSPFMTHLSLSQLVLFHHLRILTFLLSEGVLVSDFVFSSSLFRKPSILYFSRFLVSRIRRFQCRIGLEVTPVPLSSGACVWKSLWLQRHPECGLTGSVRWDRCRRHDHCYCPTV